MEHTGGPYLEFNLQRVHCTAQWILHNMFVYDFISVVYSNHKDLSSVTSCQIQRDHSASFHSITSKIAYKKCKCYVKSN